MFLCSTSADQILAELTFYTVVLEDVIPGVKRPRREAGHSPPHSAQVFTTWIWTAFFYLYFTVNILHLSYKTNWLMLF